MEFAIVGLALICVVLSIYLFICNQYNKYLNEEIKEREKQLLDERNEKHKKFEEYYASRQEFWGKQAAYQNEIRNLRAWTENAVNVVVKETK